MMLIPHALPGSEIIYLSKNVMGADDPKTKSIVFLEGKISTINM